MLTECTKYVVAVYSSPTGPYKRPVIAWQIMSDEEGFDFTVAMVYDEHAGLEPADLDENFACLSFDPDDDLEELAGCVAEQIDAGEVN